MGKDEEVVDEEIYEGEPAFSNVQNVDGAQDDVEDEDEDSGNE